MTHRHQAPDPDDPFATAPDIVLTGPATLAAAIPQLMEVPPSGAVVMVPMGIDGRLGTIYSRDLPPMPVGASPELLRHWAGEIARDLAHGVALLSLQPDEELAVALFLPHRLGTPPAWFGEAVLGQLRRLPGLLDVIAVFGDRWRSLVCWDPECCPLSGSAILDNSDAALVAAQLVAAGCFGGPVEAANAEATAEAASAGASDAVAAALGELRYPRSVSARRRLLRRAWRLARRSGEPLEPGDIACLVLAADRPGVRDALLTRVARAAERDADVWAEQASLWAAVAAQAPGGWGAGAATMCAVARWCGGDREGASAALEHALRLQPDHRMASLLHALVRRSAGPAEWVARLATILEDDCLAFDRPPTPDRWLRERAG